MLTNPARSTTPSMVMRATLMGYLPNGVRRVHLVLHDFGGAWGLTWAATHTASLASLTLINIGVMPGYRWHFLARIWRTPVLGEIFMATTTRFGFKKLFPGSAIRAACHRT